MKHKRSISKLTVMYNLVTLSYYRLTYKHVLGLLLCMTVYACQQKSYTTYTDKVEEPIIHQMDKYKNSNIDRLPVEFFNTHWVNQYEQNDQNVKPYYPATILEPSFWPYRDQLIFSNDNTCQHLYLAPNDAHHLKEASWAYFPPTLYILQDKVDIIKSFDLLSIKDTLMVVRSHGAPINQVFGKWQLISYGDEDMSDDNYILNIRGSKFEVIQDGNLIHTAEMSHSKWRLQEPLTMSFDPAIADQYPWLNSSPYGVSNDTLTLEVMDGQYSKFVSPKRM